MAAMAAMAAMKHAQKKVVLVPQKATAKRQLVLHARNVQKRLPG